MDERRDNNRSPIELGASFGIPSAIEQDISASIVNVSRGGFCIISDQKLKLGQLLHLSIEIKENENIEVSVKVAWIEPLANSSKFKIGVSIQGEDNEHYSKFINFYQSLNEDLS